MKKYPKYAENKLPIVHEMSTVNEAPIAMQIEEAPVAMQIEEPPKMEQKKRCPNGSRRNKKNRIMRVNNQC